MRSRTPIVAVAALLATGCNELNPIYEGSDSGTGSTSGSSTGGSDGAEAATQGDGDAGDATGAGEGSDGSDGSTSGVGDTTGGTADSADSGDSSDESGDGTTGPGTTGDPSTTTGVSDTSTSTTGITTSGGTTTGGTTTTGGASCPGPGSVQYRPVVAECRRGDADPDDCRASEANDTMVVDGSPTWRGYLRFDLDDAFAACTVTAVVLRLVVTQSQDSNSNQTGEVWEVTSFDLGSLYVGEPNPVGGGPLAPDQGPVTQGEVVDFDLPVGSVAPSAPVYLAIQPVLDDGVEYFNLDGVDPPLLLIDYQ